MYKIYLLILFLPFFTYAQDIDIRSINEEIRVVNGYVSNFGFDCNADISGTSQSVNIRYYLSADTILNTSNDVLISNSSMSLFKGLVSYGQSLSITNYPKNNYLILVANYNKTFSETNYANNSKFARLIYEEPFNNLIANDIRTNDLYYQVQGNSVRLIFNIKNGGNISISPSYRILVSTDTVADAGDHTIYSEQNLSSLNPNGTTSNFIKDFSDTKNLSGIVYFILQTDPSGLLNESNENDNTKYISFNFQKENYEVKVDSLKIIEKYLSADASFSFNYYFGNSGTTYAQSGHSAFKTSFYISTDATLSPDDSLIITATNNVTGPNQSRANFLQARIPKSFSDKSQVYLLYILNSNQQLRMDDPLNNFMAVPIILQEKKAEISVISSYPYFNTPAYFLKPGQSLVINQIITNTGTLSVPLEVKYYLSSDSIFDLSDELIKEQFIGEIPARNSIYNYNYTLIETLNKPQGKYYIILIEDPNNLVNDLNESNNVTISPLFYYQEFKPEFTFEFSEVFKREATPGDEIGYKYYVYSIYELSKNLDPALVYTQIYISKDNKLDKNDMLIRNDPYQFGDQSRTFTVPLDWNTDSLYLIFDLNGTRLFEENLYTNNRRVNGIKINNITASTKDPDSAQDISLFIENKTLVLKEYPKRNLSIYTISGQQVLNHDISGHSEISLNNLNEGVYILILNSENASMRHKILLK